MGKKLRSQRRKKGGGGDDDSGEASSLAEDHTLADSISTNFEDEMDDDGDFQDGHVDDLLSMGSIGSHTNAATAASSRQAKLVDALAGLDELPTEKRSANREAALRKAFKALTHYATGAAGQEVAYKHQDATVQACLNGLKLGGAAEQYAACRVLQALAIILGGDNDEYCESILPSLKRAVMATGRATAVRGAALRTIAIVHFVCASGDADEDGWLDFMEQVAQPEYRQQVVPATLRATACDCWALLATTMHSVYISGNEDDMIGRGLVLLPLLQSCLEDSSSSMDLQSAAGECVALIHECRLELGSDEDKFAQGSWDNAPNDVQDCMSEIQQLVSDLSTESARHLSKKAKKQQRATFREYLATLVDDEEPEETLNFRGGSLTLSSWKEIVQINFVRHVLQGGFQIQLLTNETLQMIFGADGGVLNSAANLTQLEKRLYMSKTSEAAKNAHVELTRKRRVRANVKNDFLTCDDD